VSSISVSRPAITTPAPAPNRGRRAARAFGAVAALLAIAGVVLGGLALQETLAGAHNAGTANEVAHETRAFALVKPTTSPSKAAAPSSSSTTTTTAADPPPKPAPPRAAPPPPPVTAKPPKPNTACDPPYTIDPATGRKKYKLECLK
jgi:hypothetical protein